MITLKGYDLILISLDNDELSTIENSFLNEVWLLTPILIRKGNEFFIFADKNGNGKWELRPITTKNINLNELPFAEGIIRRHSKLFTQSLIDTLKENYIFPSQSDEDLDNLSIESLINLKSGMNDYFATVSYCLEEIRRCFEHLMYYTFRIKTQLTDKNFSYPFFIGDINKLIEPGSIGIGLSEVKLEQKQIGALKELMVKSIMEMEEALVSFDYQLDNRVEAGEKSRPFF
jgi:hypothetical protein